MSDLTVGRIEQLTRAHKSAKPKHSNPAWVHTHRDLGIALEEIERQKHINATLLKEHQRLIAENTAKQEQLDRFEALADKKIDALSADSRHEFSESKYRPDRCIVCQRPPGHSNHSAEQGLEK